MRKRTYATFLGIALLLATLGASPQRAAAGTLSTSVIGMFPKEIGEFAYADLKSARKFPWFPQLRDQLLPSRFRQFEKFLSSAGVDPDTQVDELAWGGVAAAQGKGEQVVGVALGSFDPSSSEARFKQQKLPIIEIHGYHLYAFGSGSGPDDILFMFIDANTAAFGHRSALEKLIDVRTGVAESLLTNDTLFPLINEANGTGIIWARTEQGLRKPGHAATDSASQPVSTSGRHHQAYTRYDDQRGRGRGRRYALSSCLQLAGRRESAVRRTAGRPDVPALSGIAVKSGSCRRAGSSAGRHPPATA